MQKKPELKQIDFIVYPFINAGIELATKSGKRKYDQWMKRIEALGKRKGVFIFIKRSSQEYPISDAQTRESKKLADEFMKHLEKHLSGRYLESNINRGRRISPSELLRVVQQKFCVGNKLFFTTYGVHAEDCVETRPQEFISAFKKAFKGTTISVKVPAGLSLKHPISFLGKRLGVVAPWEKGFSKTKMLQTKQLVSLLKEGRINPVQLANAIRKGKTASERIALANQAAQGKKVVKKFRRLPK